MDSLLESDLKAPSLCAQCQKRRRVPRVRRLHESCLSLGESGPSYTTTHLQSFGGFSGSGHQLIFKLRELSFPSQHRSKLDLTDNEASLRLPLQSHSKDVHGPKLITAKPDLRTSHWTLYRSGRAAREIITDQMCVASEHRSDSTKRSVPERGREQRFGKPTQWHQHDILTGEQRQTLEMKSHGRSRDKNVWPSKRRETDHCALRLY